jgi:Tfp pilus assembly protein PilV
MSNNEHGLTLIEIVFALFVMGVGLVGLLAVVPVAAFGIQGGVQASTATYLAQQRIEQARAARWTAAPALDCLGASSTATSAPAPTGATCNGSTAVTFPDEAAGTIPGAGQYSRTTRIFDCAGGVVVCAGGVGDPTLRLVRVTVGYRPMTASGVSPVDTTVMLEWLVAQR